MRALYELDGGRFRPVAVRGTSRVVAWAREQSATDPPPGSSIDRLRRGERFVHLLDARDTDAYRASQLYREMIDISGCRSSIAVALRREDNLLGVIAIYRQEVRPFSDKQIALLENFAAQAVIAMKNARLLTETREALEQQTATAEVLGVINCSPGSLNPVFEAILEKAHGICGIDYGSLQLYEEGRFRAVAVHGLPEALADRLKQGYTPSPTLPNYKLLDGAPIVQIPDMAEIDDPMARSVVELGGTRTHLCVALRKDNTLLGQIVAARKEVRPFSDKEIALLQNFAAQAHRDRERAAFGRIAPAQQRSRRIAQIPDRNERCAPGH
jgi:GAF domain-containing protein